VPGAGRRPARGDGGRGAHLPSFVPQPPASGRPDHPPELSPAGGLDGRLCPRGRGLRRSGRQRTVETSLSCTQSKGEARRPRLSACRKSATLQGEPISACYAGQKFLPPGIPLGTKLSAEPRTRRKAARTLSALNFPVGVPTVRTCRPVGTFWFHCVFLKVDLFQPQQ